MRLPAIHVVAAILLLSLASNACDDRDALGPSRTLTTHPRALDRFASLMRRELASTQNPHDVAQEITCEIGRIMTALGPDETTRRINGVEDSLLKTPGMRARRRYIDGQLGGQIFDISGPLCDSLDAVANRTAPIVPADVTIQNDTSSARLVSPPWDR